MLLLRYTIQPFRWLEDFVLDCFNGIRGDVITLAQSMMMILINSFDQFYWKWSRVERFTFVYGSLSVQSVTSKDHFVILLVGLVTCDFVGGNFFG